MNKIYTIGHSRKDLTNFLKELASFEVELLVDVRSSPQSRFAPQFNRKNLIEIMQDKYVFMGDKIGGFGERGTPQYQEGLKELMKLAEEKTLAVMCSEQDPDKCHRKQWIAEDLREQFKVDCYHIRSFGDLYQAQMTLLLF